MIPGLPSASETFIDGELLPLLAAGNITVAALLEHCDVSLLVGAHIALSIGLVTTGVVLYRRGEGRPTIHLSILAVVAFGPFGVAGSALACLLRTFFARRAQPFAAWYASLFPHPATERARILYDLLVMRRGGSADPKSVASLFDILAIGTVNQKQSALTLIADHFHPSFAPALRNALSDPEPIIRVLGATAVARLESQFATRWAALSQRLALHPKDPDAALAAAEHLAAYAESGLLDEVRAHEIWRSALALTQQGPVNHRTDPHFAVLASRILLRIGQPDEAIRLLTPWINQPDPFHRVLLQFLESLFTLGRFEELRHACQLYGPQLQACQCPVKIREALHLWTTGHRVTL